MKHTSVWPEQLRLRDTGLHDDEGGLGQRIYTTAGAGYEKREYTRTDVVDALRRENDALRTKWLACQDFVSGLEAERDEHSLAAHDLYAELEECRKWHKNAEENAFVGEGLNPTPYREAMFDVGDPQFWIDRRVACISAGYPPSEADYVSIQEYVKALEAECERLF